MTRTDSPVPVRIFTAPDASCGAGMTWAAAVGFVGGRLCQRFEGRVAVEHIELFSRRNFEFPAVLAAVEHGSELPIVTVGDRFVSQGGKLSETRIASAVESLSKIAQPEWRE